MAMTIDYLAAGYLLITMIIAFLALGIALPIHKKKHLHLIATTAVLLIITITSIALFLFGQVSILLGVFLIYPFSMLFVGLFATSLLMINIISYEHSSDYSSFALLLGFASLGMFLIAMANSLVTILLGMELMTLPTAFMIMINGKQYVEAAVKLFVLAAISLAVLAFAIVLIFPYDPQLLLTQLVQVPTITGNYLTILSLFLFIAALSFDASLFPFNLWVPDVYSGSPANITALLAGVNKKVAFVALFQILFIVMAPFIGIYSLVFEILSIATMFFGNLAALVQNNVKRLFAYSAISQAGYIALGLAAGTQYGLEASIFQIVAHSFMIIGSFTIIFWLEGKNIRTIQDYAGLSSRNRLVAFALTIFMLSMIGIPPLIGFIGKFLLFTSVIQKGLLLLAVIAILNSFISVYYYAKVILSMYSKKENEPIKSDWATNTVITLCLAMIILVGVYPQPLITIASIAGQSLALIH